MSTATRTAAVAPSKGARDASQRHLTRVLSYLSKHYGLAEFIALTTDGAISPCEARVRAHTALERAFADSTDAHSTRLFIYAVNNAAQLRRLVTHRSDTAPVPLALVYAKTLALRLLRAAPDPAFDAALTCVLAAHVCSLASRFSGAARAVAFARTVDSIQPSARARLPDRLADLRAVAGTLTRGPRLQGFLTALDGLADEYSVGRALAAVNALLDSIKLDETWVERMDRVDNDVQRGELVPKTELVKRGLSLMRRGVWVRSGSPPRNRDGKEIANEPGAMQSEGEKQAGDSAKTPVVTPQPGSTEPAKPAGQNEGSPAKIQEKTGAPSRQSEQNANSSDATEAQDGRKSPESRNMPESRADMESTGNAQDEIQPVHVNEVRAQLLPRPPVGKLSAKGDSRQRVRDEGSGNRAAHSRSGSRAQPRKRRDPPKEEGEVIASGEDFVTPDVARMTRVAPRAAARRRTRRSLDVDFERAQPLRNAANTADETMGRGRKRGREEKAVRRRSLSVKRPRYQLEAHEMRTMTKQQQRMLTMYANLDSDDPGVDIAKLKDLL